MRQEVRLPAAGRTVDEDMLKFAAERHGRLIGELRAEAEAAAIEPVECCERNRLMTCVVGLYSRHECSAQSLVRDRPWCAADGLHEACDPPVVAREVVLLGEGELAAKLLVRYESRRSSLGNVRHRHDVHTSNP